MPPQNMNNGKNPMPASVPEKPAKPAKAPKAPKAKSSVGTKVYIVLSILIIIGLGVVGFLGYKHYTEEIDKLKDEKATLETDLASAESTYEGEISDLNSEISALESDVEDLNTTISGYESDIETYKTDLEAYGEYDELIAFADGASGQGTTEFFCSDTVFHLSKGDVANLRVYFALAGYVEAVSSNGSVVTCEWDESEEIAEVGTLFINAVGEGYAELTLTNDQNSDEITIFIYVD